MNELACLNCGHVPPEPQFFAGVLVCPACMSMACRFEARADKELLQLRGMLREAIRVALVEGRLRRSTHAVAEEDVTKTDLLRAVVELAERKE